MRRDYGQGSISWRKRDQRFEVKLRVVVEGKATRKGLGTARTMTEARKLLSEGRKKYILPSGEKRQQGAADTVGTFITRWLEKSVKPGRASTHALYAQHMRLYVLPVVGEKRLDALTRADVEAIQRHANKLGVGAATIGLTLKILTTALNYAVIKEEIAGARNVVRGTDRLYRIKPRAYTFLTPEEATHLLRATAGSRYSNAYAVMLYCGLRVNECLALRWQDIDLDKGTLHVAHSLSHIGHGVRQLGATKTEKSNRMVELPAIAVTALKAQRRTQMDEQSAGTPWLNDDGLVFTAAYGVPASDSTVRKEFAHHVATAGLPESLRLHDLRHSYATILGSVGTPISVISEQMGHSKVSITQDIYAHVMPTMRRAAADAMDGAFGG